MQNPNLKKLSIVVRILEGGKFLSRLLDSLVRQTNMEHAEILVVYDTTLTGVGAFKDRYPELIFLNMGDINTNAKSGTYYATHEMIDKRTAFGIENANGEIIGLLEDTCIPNENWCEQVLEAHLLPHEVIGGAIEHVGKGALNWATFFLDFSRYQPPLTENWVSYLSDVNITYKRGVLEKVRENWKDHYNEFLVHEALAKLNIHLCLKPQILVYQDRGNLRLETLIRERFAWGRYFAGIRSMHMTIRDRMLYIILSPAIPVIILARITAKVFKTNRHIYNLLIALPYLCLLTLAWSCGEFIGYLTGRVFALKSDKISENSCDFNDY